MAVEAGLSVYVVGGQGVRLFVVVVSCGQAIFCNADSDLTLFFPTANFQTLAVHPSFYFIDLFLSLSIVSIIKTESSAYSNSLKPFSHG